ncbi:MAG: leucine-rich repeat domain-containing protein [Chitinophagaceae bacterium]|nr:MAG: leucine-rich repeat domain-containing protein [Chitinophagaceae bacterium]
MLIDAGWWRQLSQPWKNAFAEVFFKHTSEPTSEELARLFASPALRFAGPEAPHANMSFALTDLSGIKDLVNLQVLVVIFHEVERVDELVPLVNLKALFLHNNRIRTISGLALHGKLEQLFLQHNAIESIREVETLTSLRELYIHANRLTSLEGLTEAHSDCLKRLVCLPNEGLKQKEIIRVERELFIRCHGL